ncbi:MAG: TrkH family potassium uptake protein [Candidatus Omnitrophica bacterium]|nr:TrkH family potassium uptake protein [Candidatus Omnitrophota bacterium]
MIPQFSREDLKGIFHYIGKLIIALGYLFLVPVFVGLIYKEWDCSLDFIISSLLSFSFGYLLIFLYPEESDINWRQAMTITSIIWLVYMFLGAFPLFLSGHYNSYLDSCFESMSALATTGLVLVRDLDHMAYTYNFWRHFMCFIGGQGIVLVGLLIFFKGASAFKIYVGEGREEKILPNVVQTAKFIWLVSICYLIIFTLVLGFINILHGIPPSRAFFHALCIFMAGWDTAGFAVQSQNITYYHSGIINIITALIVILGALSFGLHYAVWTGKFREILKNYELKIFLISIMLLIFFSYIGYIKGKEDTDFVSSFRIVSYHIISGHTGVGYTNADSYHFKHHWSEFSLAFLIIAMGLGGCSCSTSGGIKMLRIGLFLKEIKKEIKEFSSPFSTVIVEKFHHIRDISISDAQIKTSIIIVLMYIITYLLGGIIGSFLGYPFLYSLFESTSACANVGLSVGITNPSMPNILKIVYIIEMWIGRLEFISIFVFIKFLFSLRSPE